MDGSVIINITNTTIAEMLSLLFSIYYIFNIQSPYKLKLSFSIFMSLIYDYKIVLSNTAKRFIKQIKM